MKTNILGLIPQEYLPDTGAESTVIRKVAASYVDLPSPESSKLWRGFNHIITTHLLCPAKHLEQFKRDPAQYAHNMFTVLYLQPDFEPRTQQDLKHRRLRLIDRDGYPFFPAFLYSEEMMDGSATKGLFRGPLLVKVGFVLSPKVTVDTRLQAYRHLFLGPSQSHSTSTKTNKKKGNAAIHGMHTVKPSTLCYTVIQVTQLAAHSDPQP